MTKLDKMNNDIYIEKIFERKSTTNRVDKRDTSIENITNLTEQDKKIIFMLENNLLANIGKIEASGYRIKENHKEQYYKQLYQEILKNPEKVIKEYINNNIEIPETLLAICLIVDNQQKKTYAWYEIEERIASFKEKVKKALTVDPVANYKIKKTNDKQFINHLFDIWYFIGEKHLNDIEEKITNKTTFLFFKINKSKNRLKKDIKIFMEKTCQEHIYQGEKFFNIPFNDNTIASQLDIEKIVKAKKLIQRQEKINANLKNLSHELKILNKEEIIVSIEKIEETMKNYYKKEQKNVINSVENRNNEEILNSVETKNKEKNNLPKEAIEIIEEINMVSSQLYKKKVSQENQDMIYFLCHDKLADIIKKYMNIDQQYRENLKSIQGKNAKQLMIESLCIIKENLQHIEKEMNEEKLQELSIQTRYLKNTLKK